MQTIFDFLTTLVCRDFFYLWSAVTGWIIWVVKVSAACLKQVERHADRWDWYKRAGIQVCIFWADNLQYR